MKLVQVTPPSSEPLSVADAKAFMRVSHDLDDTLIGSLISTARKRAEDITNRSLASATWALYFDAKPSGRFELPKPPLVSVSSVRGLISGVWEDLSHSLDDKADPATLLIDDERQVDDEINSVAVEYTSGYVTLPDAILTWMKVMVSTWYEQRETFTERSIENLPRTFVDCLLDSYRVRIV